jgi:flagellar motility protein MotE (MotC chaperone)
MKSNFVIILIIICLIVVLLAGLFAADKMGIIDISDQLANTFAGIPIIGEDFKSETDNEETGIPEASPLEEENQILRLQITDLENRIVAIQKEKETLLQQNDEDQQELNELRDYKENKENIFIEAQQMAAYYREMKPDAIIRVMDNLDDDTIVIILPLLDSEQVAKILSLMEPQRAALLTQMLLGNNPVLEE